MQTIFLGFLSQFLRPVRLAPKSNARSTRKKQADTQLPLQYTFIILTPLLSIGMDGFVAFIRSGVPTECLVSYGFSVVLGVLLCWAAASQLQYTDSPSGINDLRHKPENVSLFWGAGS